MSKTHAWDDQGKSTRQERDNRPGPSPQPRKLLDAPAGLSPMGVASFTRMVLERGEGAEKNGLGVSMEEVCTQRTHSTLPTAPTCP